MLSYCNLPAVAFHRKSWCCSSVYKVQDSAKGLDRIICGFEDSSFVILISGISYLFPLLSNISRIHPLPCVKPVRTGFYSSSSTSCHTNWGVPFNKKSYEHKVLSREIIFFQGQTPLQVLCAFGQSLLPTYTYFLKYFVPSLSLLSADRLVQ